MKRWNGSPVSECVYQWVKGAKGVDGLSKLMAWVLWVEGVGSA